MGTKPRLATRAVISTGRRRVSAPSRMAWPTGLPSSIRPRMKLTMTTPFSTATPDRAMKPTPAEIDNGSPRSASAATPPVSARGTPEKTMALSRQERNRANSRPKISSKTAGTTNCNRLAAEISCSKVPP